jgi:hypothetical protein
MLQPTGAQFQPVALDVPEHPSQAYGIVDPRLASPLARSIIQMLASLCKSLFMGRKLQIGLRELQVFVRQLRVGTEVC